MGMCRRDIVEAFWTGKTHENFTEQQVVLAARALLTIARIEALADPPVKLTEDDFLGPMSCGFGSFTDDAGVGFAKYGSEPIFRYGQGSWIIQGYEKLGALMKTHPEAVEVYDALTASAQVLAGSPGRLPALQDLSHLEGIVAAGGALDGAQLDYRRTLIDALRGVVSEKSLELHKVLVDRWAKASAFQQRRMPEHLKELDALEKINAQLTREVELLSQKRALPMAVDRPLEQGTYLLVAGVGGHIEMSYKLAPETVVYITKVITRKPFGLRAALAWKKVSTRLRALWAKVDKRVFGGW